MQARDAAENNKTDAADRWAVRYSVIGANLADDVDLLPLGSGLYSAPFNLLSVGLGNATMEIYLVDNQVGRSNEFLIYILDLCPFDSQALYKY